MPESNRRIRSHGKANGVLFPVQGLKQVHLAQERDTKNTRITIYSGQIRSVLTFVSTSWRHPCDPTPGITLKRMSTMANTTPIVTTVTNPAANPRDADATHRVNIQDFCKEYYEDILPIIMDKVRCDKRKEVYAREHFCGVGESYDDSYSHSYYDRDRSRHMKRRRDNESPLSSVSKSDSSDG
nr:hypothetical protein [Tanacetum cinerariifolium]